MTQLSRVEQNIHEHKDKSCKVNEWVEFNYAISDTVYVISEAVLTSNRSTDSDKTK